MCLFPEPALRDSHIILGGQATVGSVVAVKSVLQVYVGLPNEVIRTHEVVIEYGHSQLWLGWEGDAQLQDPGQEGKMAKDSSVPSKGTWGGSPIPHHHQASCLSKSLWSPGPPHSPAQGPASLSKDRVELLGDVAFLGVPLFLASAHHHVGVCLTIGIRRSQIGSLGGWNPNPVASGDMSCLKPRSLLDLEVKPRASSMLIKHSID